VWFRRAAVATAAGLALAPVWLSPVLVTTDGPSHLYNAFLAAAIRAGRAPFAAYLGLTPGALRPNEATAFLLGALGRTAGWELAERVVLSGCILATFAGLMALAARAPAAVAGALAVAAAWIAQGWVAWMGFYDFALSLAWYAGLMLVLARPPAPSRALMTQAVFGALYLTHFLTFALGVALAAAVLSARAATRRERWRELLAVVPGVLLALIELTGGGTGAGGLGWGEPRRQLAGLVLGDVVMSAGSWDAAAGAAITAAALLAVWQRLRAARRGSVAVVNGAEWFALALFVLSVVGPDRVGEGGFVGVRLRCLALITVFPTMARALSRIPERLLGGSAVALTALLAVHAAAHVRMGQAGARDLAVLDRLFTTAGAPEGAWVARRFTGYRRDVHGIAPRSHLLERLALRRRFIVLDNYEALFEIFDVSWRQRPDWVTFVPVGATLVARLVPGTVRWPGPLYLVHERERRLAAADRRLVAGRTVSEGDLAVTPLRRP
jgi:hypothetical protein